MTQLQIITVTYSECVSVALVIQHGKRMRHVVLSFVDRLAQPYYLIFSHKQHEFQGGENSD